VKDQVKKDVSNPVGLAKLLNLSPTSTREVSAAAARGVRKTKIEESPLPNVRNRASRFLDDVAGSVAPIVKHICSMSKFNNKSKPTRVIKRVLQRISTNSRSIEEGLGSKGKPVVNTRKAADVPLSPKIDKNVDRFLHEMAKSWRQARRNHDKIASATILQMVLKAIPKATGTCTRTYNQILTR